MKYLLIQVLKDSNVGLSFFAYLGFWLGFAIATSLNDSVLIYLCSAKSQ